MSEQVKRLAEKIKQTRLTNQVSLRELAKHTGLTRSFLSQVERSISAPSIASMEKIAYALNTELSYFFKEDFPQKFSIFRKKRKKIFLQKDTKISCEVLVSDLLGIAMIPLLFTLNRGARIGEERLWHYKKERFMLTQEGKVELTCSKEDKKKFVLEEGDSLYCKCECTCKEMKNVGNKKAVILWVVRAPLL